MQIAQEIYEIFPHEFPEVYYVPYVNKPNKAPQAAKGKLWNTYIYLRRCYKKYGILPGTSEDGEQKETDDEEENKLDQLIWLRNNREPFNTCLNYWQATSSIRIRDCQSTTILDYFKQFPALKQPLGYLLVSDFVV